MSNGSGSGVSSLLLTLGRRTLGGLRRTQRPAPRLKTRVPRPVAASQPADKSPAATTQPTFVTMAPAVAPLARTVTSAAGEISITGLEHCPEIFREAIVESIQSHLGHIKDEIASIAIEATPRQLGYVTEWNSPKNKLDTILVLSPQASLIWGLPFSDQADYKSLPSLENGLAKIEEQPLALKLIKEVLGRHAGLLIRGQVIISANETDEKKASVAACRQAILSFGQEHRRARIQALLDSEIVGQRTLSFLTTLEELWSATKDRPVLSTERMEELTGYARPTINVACSHEDFALAGRGTYGLRAHFPELALLDDISFLSTRRTASAMNATCIALKQADDGLSIEEIYLHALRTGFLITVSAIRNGIRKENFKPLFQHDKSKATYSLKA